jgi:hypothetical protein
MLDTSIGFSLMVSVIITTIMYVITRDKHKSEQSQKDKLNDTIILFVITFIVVLFAKLCLSEQTSTTLVKTSDIKGGQCPF